MVRIIHYIIIVNNHAGKFAELAERDIPTGTVLCACVFIIDSLVVASVLKAYFTEAPTPILPEDKYSQLINAARMAPSL